MTPAPPPPDLMEHEPDFEKAVSGPHIELGVLLARAYMRGFADGRYGGRVNTDPQPSSAVADLIDSPGARSLLSDSAGTAERGEGDD